jgi:hypothetical protein
MLMSVYKLIFRKLKIEIVNNSNSVNKIDTSYPHKNKKYILLKNKELSRLKLIYHHIHNAY